MIKNNSVIKYWDIKQQLPVIYQKNKPQVQHSISKVFNKTAYIQTIGSNIILHTQYLCAALSNTSDITSYWVLKYSASFFFPATTLYWSVCPLWRGASFSTTAWSVVYICTCLTICLFSNVLSTVPEKFCQVSAPLCHCLFSKWGMLIPVAVFAEWITALFCFGFYLFWLSHHNYRSSQDNFVTPCSLVISHNHYLSHRYWFLRPLFLKAFCVSFMKIQSLSFVIPFLVFCSLFT